MNKRHAAKEAKPIYILAMGKPQKLGAFGKPIKS